MLDVELALVNVECDFKGDRKAQAYIRFRSPKDWTFHPFQSLYQSNVIFTLAFQTRREIGFLQVLNILSVVGTNLLTKFVA